MSPGQVDSAVPSVSTRWSQAVVAGSRDEKSSTPSADRTDKPAAESAADLRKRLLKLIVANEKSRRSDAQQNR